jgi:hypothetical protein
VCRRPGTKEDEDNVTLQMMLKFGWQNVRGSLPLFDLLAAVVACHVSQSSQTGGRWCNRDMARPPDALLSERDRALCRELNKVVLDAKAPAGSARVSAGASGDKGGGSGSAAASSSGGMCFRCGRAGHWVSDCYAKTDVLGAPLVSTVGQGWIALCSSPTLNPGGVPLSLAAAAVCVDQPSAVTPVDKSQRSQQKQQTSASRDHPTTASPAKKPAAEHKAAAGAGTGLFSWLAGAAVWVAEAFGLGCSRCGRRGHGSSTCYAKTDTSGKRLDAGSEAGKKVLIDNGNCFRCGRTGHWAADCFAKTHASGGSLL